MAALVEGRHNGKLLSVATRPFEIIKHIRLPKYLADGDYLLDLDLHQPLIQDYFCS